MRREGDLMDTSPHQHWVDAIACPNSPLGIDAKKTHVLILTKLESIERRLDAIERQANDSSALQPRLAEALAAAPQAVAALTDIVDDEVARAADRGQDLDRALRNGLAAALYFGERTSAAQLDALGALLGSDVLHPSTVDLIGRLGQALVSTRKEPRGSAGMWRTLTALRDPDTRRCLDFLLAFAQRFGAALGPSQETTPRAPARSSDV